MLCPQGGVGARTPALHTLSNTVSDSQMPPKGVRTVSRAPRAVPAHKRTSDGSAWRWGPWNTWEHACSCPRPTGLGPPAPPPSLQTPAVLGPRRCRKAKDRRESRLGARPHTPSAPPHPVSRQNGTPQLPSTPSSVCSPHQHPLNESSQRPVTDAGHSWERNGQGAALVHRDGGGPRALQPPPSLTLPPALRRSPFSLTSPQPAPFPPAQASQPPLPPPAEA